LLVPAIRARLNGPTILSTPFAGLPEAGRARTEAHAIAFDRVWREIGEASFNAGDFDEDIGNPTRMLPRPG
jgi:hypothetical protein